MSKLLALDQASITSGYAVFDEGKLIDYGKFTFNDSNLDQRLVDIRNKLLSLLERYDISEVVFEDIQQQENVSNNVQTFKVLAEVYGVIAEMLEEKHIPHTSILATVWKKGLGIKGRQRTEQKRNAQEYVFNTYGRKPTQDEADAICIGLYHLYNNQNDWSN